jgi:integrase
MRKAGITRKVLGVTPHGLRHQLACDLYIELAELPPPIRGGDSHNDPEVLRQVLLEVARQLGHNRTQIVGAYCGKHCARLEPRDV